MLLSTLERRLEEKEKRRNEIVDAAERVFAKKGYEKASMGDVADAARLSRGLLYVYFKDKKDLYMAIAARAMEMLLDKFEKVVQGKANGFEKMRAIGDAYIRFAHEQPEYFETMGQYVGTSEIESPSFEACHESSEGIFKLMGAIIQEGIHDGSIRADIGDPLLTAVNLWGLTHGLLVIGMAKGEHLEQEHGVPMTLFMEHGMAMIDRILQP